MQKTSVAIFGAGIVGAFIFNTLTLNGVSAILIDKQEDVSMGATKANSGIIHAGYDCLENTLKAKFNVLGNKMYKKIAKRLGEKIVECGSLVVGNKDSLPQLKVLLQRGKHNGVKKLKIVSGKKLKKLEPNLNKNIYYALYAPDAKIISPYHFCISLCEEAILNGGILKLNYNTTCIKKEKNCFVISNGKEKIITDYIINACAEGVNQIGAMLQEEIIPLSFTKGEYILLDNSEQGLVSRPIFPLPTKQGKGIICAPTVHNNIFCGPTAVDIDKFETSFSFDSLAVIKEQVNKNIENINYKKIIKLYAGVRVKHQDDFLIKSSVKNPNYIVLAGICSPGLSAAPAIAQYILEILCKKGLKTSKIKITKRKPYTNLQSLTKQKINRLIKSNSDYGEMICSCEKITKGEILEALKGPISPLTTDGIKRRLRVTMGSCQGSFCYPKLLKIMAEFYKTSQEKIIYKGSSSLVVGDIKEGGIYEK